MSALFHVELVSAGRALLGANFAANDQRRFLRQVFSDSNKLSGSALFTATHCMMPVPSRNCGKQIFAAAPQVVQPARRSRRSRPTCRPASATVTRGTVSDSVTHLNRELSSSPSRSNDSARRRVERIAPSPGTSFNSSSSGYDRLRTRATPWSRGQSMVPPSVEQRKQVRVVFPIIVVHVRGTDAALQQPVSVLHAFVHIGVAGVEADIQIQMRRFEEHQQALRARQARWAYFRAAPRRRAGARTG